MNEPILQDYLFTIRIPIIALDDMAARETALTLIEQHMLKGAELKLQRLNEKSQPTGVALLVKKDV
jgi:hypothetical protein